MAYSASTIFFFSLLTKVYNPKTFFPHAASLGQGCPHCPIFPTAASRIFVQHQDYEKVFHGETFHDREIDHVYMIELDQPEEAFQIEACELQSVHWLDAREIVNIIDSPDNDRICILPLEFHRLVPYLEKYYGISI